MEDWFHGSQENDLVSITENTGKHLETVAWRRGCLERTYEVDALILYLLQGNVTGSHLEKKEVWSSNESFSFFVSFSLCIFFLYKMGSFLQRLSLLGLVVVIHGRRSDRGKGKRIESRVADICFSEQLLPFPIRSLIYMKEQAQTQGKRERERSFSRRVCGKEKSAASPVDEAPPPPTAQMATFSPALSPLSLRPLGSPC